MFIVPFTSSGHWLAVLPCLLGFACSPQAWGLFAPPSDSLWVSVVGVFAFVLDFGVPLVWLCLCLLWVRLHVPFLSVTLSGSVVGLFHLSACVRWFVYLVCFLAVLFFCAVPGYVT